MTTVLNILLYLWQLPQNLLGLLLVAVMRPEAAYDLKDVRVHISTRMHGGISLGRYIIMSPDYHDHAKSRTEKHEYGHALQSRYLGPLYLLVIGLPSLIWAAWWNEDRGMSYYAFYTEAWADKLGGADRC